MAVREYTPSFDSFLLPLGLDHEGLKNVLQNKKPKIEFKTHEKILQYSPHMEGVLVDMGLHTVAVIDPPPLDRALLFALAERFRPETNTFHLPVGEMTITPKDVNVLLGMKITGLPVTGVAIKDWNKSLPAFLGTEDCVGAFRPRNSRTKGRVDTDTQINLRWLTTKFNVPLDDEDYNTDRILYYTRAYILELFGCILFPNKTRDCVHAFLIQFLEDWEMAASYNWGGAVLAYLYRSLAELAHRNTKIMTGCAWLLQLWSWSYIAIRRPLVTREYRDWLQPDSQRSHAYAMHWSEGRLIYLPLCVDLREEGSPRFGLEYMTESHVDWEPYTVIISYMPDIVYDMHPYWEICGPVIFMWACMYCYCDRVSRQFGRGFYIPRPPQPWPVHNRLNKLTSSSGTRMVDWRTKYPECLVQYEYNILSDAMRGRGTDRYGYFQWYIPTCFSSILGRTLLLPRRSSIDQGVSSSTAPSRADKQLTRCRSIHEPTSLGINYGTASVSMFVGTSYQIAIRETSPYQSQNIQEATSHSHNYSEQSKNISCTETVPKTMPQQLNTPPGYGTSGSIVIKHENEPLVPLLAGLEMPPRFSRRVEQRQENDFCRKSRGSPLPMNQMISNISNEADPMPQFIKPKQERITPDEIFSLNKEGPILPGNESNQRKGPSSGFQPQAMTYQDASPIQMDAETQIENDHLRDRPHEAKVPGSTRAPPHFRVLNSRDRFHLAVNKEMTDISDMARGEGSNQRTEIGRRSRSRSQALRRRSRTRSPVLHEN